jgi:phage/plasmid-like protein (TIGR03299 family)
MGAVPETMVSTANKTPWHGLGIVVPDEVITAHQALTLGGLDWDVELRPSYVPMGFDEDNNQIFKEVPNSFHTTRVSDGHVLGTVKGRYKILQNRDSFTFMDDLVDSGEAKYETAGQLFNGRIVWATMRLPEDLSLTDDVSENIKQYMMIQNSHDGSTAVNIVVTPVRAVCENTISAAISGASRTYSVRHTSTMAGKLTQARHALGITKAYGQKLVEVGREMLTSTLSDADFDAFLESLIPTEDKEKAALTRAENKQEILREIYKNTPDLQNIKGTHWGAYQAVIDYNDHHVKGHDKQFRSDNRMKRIMLQPNITHEAFSLLSAMR